MPTMFNKTTTAKVYTRGRVSITLPAASVAGQRGNGVPVTLETKLAMASEWKSVQADCEDGNIEIVANV